MGAAVIRIYDPDKHIIEVGENTKAVCKRFLDSGMTPEQVSERMGLVVKLNSSHSAKKGLICDFEYIW